MLKTLSAQFGAFFKALRCSAHLFHGMWTIARHFPRATPAQKAGHVAQWAQSFLRILRVELRTTGQSVTTGPLMVVANHISWLDILVMLAVQPVHFVSKSDVRHWPLIGWLATNAGTLYIERASRRDALRVVHHIAEALTEPPESPVPYTASIIAVFPEGTTSDGSVVLPFHANLIQAAISAHAPVQPIALRYNDAATGQISRVPTYIDDETLIASVWRLLASPDVQAVVHFTPVQHANGRDRRTWAADLQGCVAKALE
ncbi:MAG: lysophospholipid acyltransferase family protein [Burkholderiaceae bacterium]